MGVVMNETEMQSQLQPVGQQADIQTSNRRWSQRLAGRNAKAIISTDVARPMSATREPPATQEKQTPAPQPLASMIKPATEPRLQASLLVLLLVAAAAAATALSAALPFTQKGESSGILLGLAVTAVAASLLLHSAPLLHMAAPLRLAFLAPDKERSFAVSFSGSRMINSTMSSIALGAAHFVVMLRSICYDCSGSRGNALSHTAYFAVQISPAIAASLHSLWYKRQYEHIMVAMRSISAVMSIAWASGLVPQCTAPRDQLPSVALLLVAVYRVIALQVRLDRQLSLVPLETAAVLLTAFSNGVATALPDLLLLATATMVLPVLVAWLTESGSRARYRLQPGTANDLKKA